MLTTERNMLKLQKILYIRNMFNFRKKIQTYKQIYYNYQLKMGIVIVDKFKHIKRIINRLVLIFFSNLGKKAC